MSGLKVIIIAVIAVVLIGIIIIPLINRHSFRRLPPDQQIRILMKQAKGLAYFKNVSSGSSGVLYYVKNKRKILTLPWILSDGKMLCTKDNPFERWDYPEEREMLSEEELIQLSQELEIYNQKNPVKIIFK